MPTKCCLLLIICFFSVCPQLSATECSDCLERKKNVCAAECRLVPVEKARLCQLDCRRMYCSHRCDRSDPAFAPAPQTCQACLDEQFNLCGPNCPTGSDRARAECRLTCAKDRCSEICESEAEVELTTPSPTPKPSPTAQAPKAPEESQEKASEEPKPKENEQESDDEMKKMERRFYREIN